MHDLVAMAVSESLSYLDKEELGHVFFKTLSTAYKAKQVTTCTELHDKAEMTFGVERVVKLYYVAMMSQVLQYLQVLGDLFLTFSLLLHITFSHALDCDKVATELVLCDHNFTEGTLSQLVSYSVEFMGSCHWSAHFLEVSDDHCDQVLFVLEQWIIYVI